MSEAPSFLAAICNWTSLRFCDNHTKVTNCQAPVKGAQLRRGWHMDVSFLKYSRKLVVSVTWLLKWDLHLSNMACTRQDHLWSNPDHLHARFLLLPVCQTGYFLARRIFKSLSGSFPYRTGCLGCPNEEHISPFLGIVRKSEKFCSLLLAHFMGQLETGARGLSFAVHSLSISGFLSARRGWD